MTTLLTTPDPLPNDDAPVPADQAVLARRGLLRGGAALAGAAAGALAIGAATAAPAHAADGDSLTIGEENDGETATALTIAAGAEPALSLNNDDGPSLRLQPLASDWPGQLAPGEMAGTDLGPIVGVDTPEGAVTTYLVTGVDLVDVPSPFVSGPTRLLDLRTVAGREAIRRRSSANALTADGKLRAGAWIDVATVLTGSDYTLEAIFANLTVVGGVRPGYASLYPPGAWPGTSTVNFVKDQIVANGTFVGTSVVLGFHCVRIYTTSDAHFLLDVTGGVARGNAPVPGGQQAAARSARSRTSLVKRIAKAFGRLER